MFALVGHPTKLSDQERGLADKALRSPAWSRERGVGRGRWNAEAAESARRNLSAANGLDDHGDGNLVIEAVFESVELKRGVFQRLGAITAPTAGLGSNTSSISISSLSGALREGRGSRFLGTHFFSPVSRMRLVEVIPAMDTDPVFIE